ncbi:MAG: glycoside hydrolase family 32 protein [Pyrinomonadaceae bacterium]
MFTGSVIEANGQYHIFYTGHNPHFRKAGKPEQAVMHAVSDDLLRWRKVPADTFYAPADKYEPHDWRDPFVFWNDETKEYWMLLAARFKTGIPRRRGCTALCASKDLVKWEVREPFWAPDLYFTHECPDLFKIGDWWYLVFSEFTDLVRTHYRMSRSLKGPWLVPKNPNFDARAFYAAKTASDGQRRFIFGWDPTRQESKDYYRWHWGGNLVVHEIHQETDGELSVSIPKTVDGAFNRQVPFKFEKGVGNIKTGRNDVRVVAPGSFGCVGAEGMMPERCKIQTRIEYEKGTKGCGLMLRASDDYDRAYYIRLEPQSNRLVFDMWPRGAGDAHPITSADGAFMLDLERSIDLTSNQPIDLTVLVDGTIGIVYAGGKVAMSTRMYNLPKGQWGVFANEGSAHFRNLGLSMI